MIVGLILAKSKSKRLPNKNTLDFHGEPMFLVNVRKCLEIFDEVYVSSDSEDILAEAEAVGAYGIKREKELCGDTPNIPVYQHALSLIGDVDAIVAVQANSPTVDPLVIKRAKEMLEEGCQEVMTMNRDFEVYGSVWGMTADRLRNYDDPYDPRPDGLISDDSVDIHTLADLEEALCQS